ncbi:MAG: LysR family transcriptional regulator [Halobacteriovoraceae bacterium]|nr:LysR family transcriptional regulator [Halobacteriovoraceae bacterium]
MLPNPNDLRFFIEVSRTHNLSRAAERLGVTQPALSQGMRRLEQNIGQQLLLRGKGGVKLTKCGEKLVFKAKHLLEDWEKIKEEAERDGEDLRGRYSIGMHSSVALYSLRHFVPQLLAKFPNLEFKLVHELSRRITEDVISFKIDFGIVVNPVQHPDLVIRELFRDEVSFWRSKKETAMNSIDGKDKVLIIEPELLQTQEMLGKLSKKKMHFKRQLTSSNLEVIKDMTLAGCGVGVVPGRVVGEHSKKMEIVPGWPKFSDKICLIYRADVQKSPASRKMTGLIQEYLKNK